MQRPNIQIEDEVREMNNDEYQFWLNSFVSLADKVSAPDDGAQSSTDAG